MGAQREGRLRTTLGAFGTAFRNRSLLQVEVACLVFNGAEWGVWLALMVWSYTIGGAAAASLIVIVQLVPCIFVSPYLGAITDRARAGRVLFLGLLVMGGTMAGVAVAIAAGAPAWLVYLLAPFMNLVLSVPRPAQAALLPGVVRTPLELTAANVVSSWMENAGVPAALVAASALLLVIVAVVWRRLRTIDDSANVPQVEIQLLRLNPVFAPLPAPELEARLLLEEPLLLKQVISEDP